MAEHRLIVLSNARPGQDDSFNHWYDEEHLEDVLAVPGVSAAQRFSLAEGEAWRYAAIYEIDGDEPSTVVETIVTRWTAGEMRPTDTMDMDTMRMVLASPLGARRTA